MPNEQFLDLDLFCAPFGQNSEVQGPLVFGFFIEQLGRGTLRPLADLGGRLLEERLRNNWQRSSGATRDGLQAELLSCRTYMFFADGISSSKEVVLSFFGNHLGFVFFFFF